MWGLVCPNATWCWGCHSQSGLFSRPECQVALRSALRKGKAAHAPRGAPVYPAQGPGSPSVGCPYGGRSSARCPLSIACSPTKTCTNHFQCQMHSSEKTTPPLLPLPLQLFVLRIGLPLHYSNPQYFMSM